MGAMTTNGDDSFNASRAEVFEALGHPTRIRILQALGEKPLGYADLKRGTGIESNGLLAFHLGKLTGLVKQDAEGSYALTDEGREALRMVEASRSQQVERRAQHPAIHLPHQRAVLAGLVVFLLVLAAISAIQYSQIQGLDSRPPITSTTTVNQTTRVTSTVMITQAEQATQDALGLILLLSLNATQISSGHAINITASIFNALPSVNNVTGTSDWAIPGLQNDYLPTGSNVPPHYVSVQVSQGYYTQSNVSSANPLKISPEGFSGPLFGVIRNNYYLFQPSSNEALFPLSVIATEHSYLALPMGVSALLPGYYPLGNSSSESSSGHALLPFPAGVYTVAAGDEWGDISILHFQVN
jgi:DNA-binding transcriptional ArsR family regulator